jgi:hypothetical protein
LVSVETFTIVAFRYNKKNSVLYESTADPEKLWEFLVKAVQDLNADVISIRRVREP